MNPLDPLGLFSLGAKEFFSAIGDPLAYAKRTQRGARNAAEWISQGGGLKVDEEYSPYEVMASGRNFRLRRYFPDKAPQGLPALVFVPPLMIKADVYDIAQRSSPVRAAHENGLDVWVVDFGRPEEEEGGLKRSVGDHVVALSDAVDEVRRITGQNVVLSGYSQGGLFSYQTTAYRRNEGVDSIITFGSVVDFQSGAPLPLPMSPENYQEFAQGVLDLGIFRRGSLPGWAALAITKMIDPVKVAEYYLNYFQQLHDREQLMRAEKQRRFLDQTGWVAYPGPAMNELLEYVAHNRLLTGGVAVEGQVIALSDVAVPIFIAVGENDPQGPPAGVRGISQAAPLAEVYELTLNTGHFGIIASSGAKKWTWPRVAGWMRWRAGQGDFPEGLVRADKVTATRSWSPSQTSKQVQGVVDFAWGASRKAVQTVSGVVGAVHGSNGSRAFPLLSGLDVDKPATVMSLGLLVKTLADRHPDGVALLYGDRILRHREVAQHVDGVAKALVSIGLRRADRVGILMASPAAAFCVLASINRVGAVAVLLRPDGDLAGEAKLGAVSFVVADDEHLTRKEHLPSARWCVVGGDPAARSGSKGFYDLAKVDPDKVQMPAWFESNPHRGSDPAFVLFTGEGEQTATRTITNQRWAAAALCAASAIGLKPWDTVYATTPLHDASSLLTAAGAAVVGGARLAFAGGTSPDAFWSEVRRYGATHVSYGAASLREVAAAPTHPLERGNPIRLFFGSGMPVNIWRRLNERFNAAQVFEFYVSCEADAVLANKGGTKVGSVGRPLPGAAAVAVAAYDSTTGRFITGSDGLAQECRSDAVGLLLAQVDAKASSQGDFQGVFAGDDAWRSTGDLFSKDAEGDLWRVDPIQNLISTRQGMVAPSKVRDALAHIASVDLAVVYAERDGEHELLVAAVTLFEGAELGRWDLESALRGLPQSHHPHRVQVVPAIPLNSCFQPSPRSVCSADTSRVASDGVVWRREAGGRSYERPDSSRRKQTSSP
jgi:putative long chain acyl-CoA synthase